MRTLIVGVAALLASCGSSEPSGGGSGSDEPAKPVVPRKPPNLPRVDDADVVIAPGQTPQPAAFVWLNPTGKLEVAQVGPTWTGEPPTDRHSVFMPSEIYPEILKAAHNSSDVIRNAARDQALGRRSDPVASSIAGGPSRRVATSALVQLSEVEPIVPVIATAPSAPAQLLVRVLLRTGGILAVRHDKQPAMLKVAVKTSSDHDTPTTGWIEAHVDSSGVHVVKLPSGLVTEIPWVAGSIDVPRLTSELKAYVHDDVDVLVGGGVEAQQLIDLVVAMRKQGMTRLFLGEKPSGTLAQRIVMTSQDPDALAAGLTAADPFGPRAGVGVVGAAAVPSTNLGQPASQGDLDKAIIRRYVKRNLHKIQYCYEKSLLADSSLQGTVQVQFFISPTGSVPTASATGVSREVAECVAGVFKSIEFPAPKGGGGVQVNYPITFRPAGP